MALLETAFRWPRVCAPVSRRYTRRVAISNLRLVSLTEGKVPFRLRDSAHNNEQKLLTLSLDEFLRRFPLHMLTKRFALVSNSARNYQAMRQSGYAGRECRPIIKSALVLILLSAVASCSQVADNDPVLVKFTRPQLEAAIEETKNENTRLDGLHELIRMAGPRLYETSIVAGDRDPEMFKLRGEAALTVETCRDVDTVDKALDSPHHSVRLWALLTFETRSGHNEAWEPLVPKLVKMLSEPDPEFRQLAVDKLWFYPEARRAIAEHTPLERTRMFS